MAPASPASEAPFVEARPATTWRQHMEVALAMLVLCACDVSLRTVGFVRLWKAVASWKRSNWHRQPSQTRTSDFRRAAELRDAVERACVYYVRPVDCLTRSTATVCLLRFNRLRAELVIGVQRMPFGAHSWVEFEGALLNEHQARRNEYIVIHRC